VGIRQKINENPAATTAVTAGIVVLAVLFIMWQACSGGPGSGGMITTKAFYSVDDGKTWFIDDSSNIPPYKTKDGKDAVRAQIFTCDDGKTKFCGYLEAYAPQDKMVLENMAKNQGKAGGPPAAYMGYTGQPLVKKPGVPAWIPLSPATTPAYQQIVQVRCPDGSTNNLSRVFPE
jgi:hypothetical protein